MYITPGVQTKVVTPPAHCSSLCSVLILKLGLKSQASQKIEHILLDTNNRLLFPLLRKRAKYINSGRHNNCFYNHRVVGNARWVWVIRWPWISLYLMNSLLFHRGVAIPSGHFKVAWLQGWLHFRPLAVHIISFHTCTFQIWHFLQRSPHLWGSRWCWSWCCRLGPRLASPRIPLSQRTSRCHPHRVCILRGGDRGMVYWDYTEGILRGGSNACILRGGQRDGGRGW